MFLLVPQLALTVLIIHQSTEEYHALIDISSDPENSKHLLRFSAVPSLRRASLRYAHTFFLFNQRSIPHIDIVSVPLCMQTVLEIPRMWWSKVPTQSFLCLCPDSLGKKPGGSFNCERKYPVWKLNTTCP